MARTKKSEKAVIVNGYSIKYSNYWGNYGVSHPDIGANIAQFKFKKEAINYAKRG